MDIQVTDNVIDLAISQAKAWAIRYIRRGWHVFPLYEPVPGGCSCAGGVNCNHPGKHPRLPRGYHSSCDQADIEAWWGQWPQASIAIEPGRSDIVVLDIDPRNDGDHTLAKLEAEHGKLPNTITALTGGGGQHYYFRRPPDAIRLKSGVIGQGIDIKADSGYVVAPPSVHYTGCLYQWDSGAHPDETDLAPLPQWIRALCEKRNNHDGPATTALIQDGIMGAAFSAAGMLGRQVGSDKAVVVCPWESEHTCGATFDGSTIVFAPQVGHHRGWFHCSHNHCTGRTQEEVLNALPPAAVTAARKKFNIHPDAPLVPIVRPPEKKAKRKGPAMWRASLRFNSKDQLTNCVGNLTLYLANHDIWKDAVRYDTFRRDMFWCKQPPEVPGFNTPTIGDQFTDADAVLVGHWFDRTQGVRFSKATVFDAVAAAAHKNRFDSLLQYLDALQWDGRPRLNRWLFRYLYSPEKTGKAQNNRLSWVGRKWMISAIARAYQPGCQADHVLILEGPQGVGKDTAARILGGEFLLPDLPKGLDQRDTVAKLAGKWIVEVGELSAFRGGDVLTIKSFVTQTVDVYRKPYERIAQEYPRRCVFLATTNERQYLNDPTGARRFWPAKVRGLDRAALIRDRDQLWAEAKAAYQAGEIWHPDHQEHKAAEIAADLRNEVDVWEDQIASYLEESKSKRSYRADLGFESMAILRSLGFESPSKVMARYTHRLNRVMRKLGYEQRKRAIMRDDGKSVLSYRWFERSESDG